MPEILKEKIVFNDTFNIEEAELKSTKRTFHRMRINREDGAAVLVLNTETNKVILTKQFRYAILKHTKDEILEIVAGKVDKGYTPEETAVKETKEEIGYKLNKEDLVLIGRCFISPGYTSEKLHLYYAEVTNSQKVNEGGGLASENEDIKVTEIDVNVFLKKLAAQELSDAKTMMAAQWLVNRKHTIENPSPH